ncbi:uncharacterized protein LOC134766024 [Penaeus indicus]|uniref:uncharacterized protein LOC134766024 n=1 Tax=Penaeus indicus TaxID=29960 RepID=UPI00300CFBEC
MDTPVCLGNVARETRTCLGQYAHISALPASYLENFRVYRTRPWTQARSNTLPIRPTGTVMAVGNMMSMKSEQGEVACMQPASSAESISGVIVTGNECDIKEITGQRSCSSSNCIKASDGRILHETKDASARWEEHVQELLNDEQEPEDLVLEAMTSGPPILKSEVPWSRQQMKSGEAVPGTLELPQHRTFVQKSHIPKTLLKIILQRIRRQLLPVIPETQFGFLKDKDDTVLMVTAVNDPQKRSEDTLAAMSAARKQNACRTAISKHSCVLVQEISRPKGFTSLLNTSRAATRDSRDSDRTATSSAKSGCWSPVDPLQLLERDDHAPQQVPSNGTGLSDATRTVCITTSSPPTFNSSAGRLYIAFSLEIASQIIMSLKQALPLDPVSCIKCFILDEIPQSYRILSIPDQSEISVAYFQAHSSFNLSKKNTLVAIVVSTLLYGAESWTLYRSQVKKLHAFMMRHLRQIMRINWQDRVTNKEILHRAGLPSMEDLLIRKNLRWTGHIIRMPTDRLTRQLLFSELPVGERKIGRPRLRYKDTIKRNLKKREINIKTWTTLAYQRAKWRSAVK